VAAELTLGAATVAAAVLIGAVWDVRPGWRRGVLRTVAGLLCVITAGGTAAIWANRQTETYHTWSSLTGGTADADQPDTMDSAPDLRSSFAAPAASAAPVAPAVSGRSRIERFTVTGPASGLTLPVYAYLPPGYDQPARRSTRYPVIEALHGFPGSPRTWLHKLDVQARLDREIAAGRMAPTVVVFPYQTPDALRDTECVDLVNGPHAETFLTVDVPAAVRSAYRVRTDRAGWGLIGYSAGGFCAANLLLRHPDRYAAGASLSGYADPGITIGDGSESTTNNVAWRLRNLPPPPVALYLAAAGDDKHAMRAAGLIAGLARAPMTVTTAVVAVGGHSGPAWRGMQAPAFDWLSAHLARELVDGPV
jgi:enterochelin esterase-like enzyme